MNNRTSSHKQRWSLGFLRIICPFPPVSEAFINKDLGHNKQTPIAQKFTTSIVVHEHEATIHRIQHVLWTPNGGLLPTRLTIKYVNIGNGQLTGKWVYCYVWVGSILETILGIHSIHLFVSSLINLGVYGWRKIFSPQWWQHPSNDNIPRNYLNLNCMNVLLHSQVCYNQLNQMRHRYHWINAKLMAMCLSQNIKSTKN